MAITADLSVCVCNLGSQQINIRNHWNSVHFVGKPIHCLLNHPYLSVKEAGFEKGPTYHKFCNRCHLGIHSNGYLGDVLLIVVLLENSMPI